MKTLAIAAAFCLIAGSAFAQGATCKTNAKGSDGKPLAGAALNSYMKKCENDAKSACDKKAAAQKLNGAAKNSFTTKCVKDSVG
ncbi:MAG: hypothetical protein AB7T86_11400 [Xanthobacteraceae bacterium]|uniref:hypothetical protein n=1 Tax=Pseudolabrys sp. TaxID=1960880 RepID=UPI003D118084